MDVSEELKANTVSNLVSTLNYFANTVAQLQYQKEVSFVNIPRELIAQWEQHESLLTRTDWFPELFSEIAIKKLRKFGAKLKATRSELDLDKDLRLLIVDPVWLRLGALADDCLVSIVQ